MTKLGELLKSEREKRGLSLHEIGMSLKINPKILKAIEEGDQKNLPAKTFLRGFVKSYAQYLRLDPNQALQIFQEEYGSAKIEEPVAPPTPTQPIQAPPKYEGSLRRPEDAALPVSNNNRIYTILFAILLLTLIAFVAKMMDKYQKESRVAKVESVEPKEEVPTTTLPGAHSETVTASSADATKAISEDSSPSLTTTTSMTTTTTTHRSVPNYTPVPTTSSTTLRAALPVSTTTSTTTTTTSSTSTTTTLKSPSTEVILEALNKITVRFSLNGGQKWESLELNPDQVHTFRTKTTMQLEVSDGGAVNVIVNGRDRGVPGTIGKPIKLNFP